MTKRCNHPACDKLIDDDKYSCGPHWFILPPETRDPIAEACKKKFDIRPEDHAKAQEFWMQGASAKDRQLSLDGFSDEVGVEKAETCPNCGRRIIWGTTKDGVLVSIDPKPAVYRFEEGHLVRAEGSVTHMATCHRPPAPPVEITNEDRL